MSANHWADQAAQKLIGKRSGQDSFVLASGITPSGAVHIGNFREVITVDLVARALRKQGKKVRFIFSWDSFDTFRKVPADMPNKPLLEENLWRPIARVPDTRGDKESYAQYSIDKFEEEIGQMGVGVEFIYQYQMYTAGKYAEGMRKALEHKGEIAEILNQHRTSPLADDWLPTSVYCEKCDRDKMNWQKYDGDWGYSYSCSSCGHEGSFDIRESKNLKLSWRVDWPMRWAFEKVDFEPGGKDHSSDGGSYDTGKEIVKKIWDFDAPEYLQYDFVSIKGGPGKISSSAGNAVVLSDVLEIYSPEMIRYIFAKQRPNTDFSIAFDEDVIKIHEEFDKLESEVTQEPDGKPNKKWLTNRRVYELALVDENHFPKAKPFRPGFRVLCNRLQICDGDVERTRTRYYSEETKDAEALRTFNERAQRAWNWLEKYAPAEFKYRIHSEKQEIDADESMNKAKTLLRDLIGKTDLDAIEAKDLNQAIYDDVIRGAEVEAKPFFQLVYQHLIGRDQGPRLPSFLKEVGKDKLLELL